jgi:hypothetical protein
MIGALSLYFAFRTRQLRHQERMAAIEKGIDLPRESTPGSSALLLRGLIWFFIGIAMVLFFTIVSVVEGERDALSGAGLGLIPAGVGIAYLAVYRVRSRQERDAAEPGMPDPGRP